MKVVNWHVVGVMILFVGFLTTHGMTQTQHYVDYQGVLVSNGQPVTTPTNLTFTIYDSQVGGTVVWTEVQSVTPNSEGVFSVALGSVTPLTDTVFASPDRWLSVAITGSPEMSPRVRLMSAPYSFRVHTVDGASGGTIYGNLFVSDTVRMEGFIMPTGANANYVLTCNANGVGTWQQPPSGGQTDTAKFAWNSDSLDGHNWGDLYPNADKVDGFDANSVPTPNNLYPLDGNAKIPNARLYTGSGNGLDADMIDGKHDGQLSADIWDGHHWGNLYPNADKLDGFHAGTSSGQIPVSNGTVCSNLNADKVDGYHLADLDGRYVNEGQSNSITSAMIVNGSIGQPDVSNGYVDLSSSQTIGGSKTFSSSLDVNATCFANKFYVTDAGNNNAIVVYNNSASYPTVWAQQNGSNIAVYGQTNNGNAGNFKNSSSVYPTIWAENASGSSSYFTGIHAQVGSSSYYGLTTNGKGYFGGGTAAFTSLETAQGKRMMTSPLVSEIEIYLSGSAKLIDGKVEVHFDPNFTGMIAEPIKVIVTPTEMCKGIAVTAKQLTGFTAEELAFGKSNATFDWLVIARKAVQFGRNEAEEMPTDVPIGQAQSVDKE
jgi:hypothetical protein